MAAPLAPPDLFQFERKVDLLYISHYQISDDSEYLQNVHFFKKAQSKLFEPDPEHQKEALKIFIFISNEFGFGKDTLPPFFFKRIEELIFGNHGSIEVIELSLQLIEYLIEMSPWTIEPFLKMNLPEVLFNNINKDNTIGVSKDKLSFVLNSLLCHSSEAYSLLINLGYYNFILKLANSNLSQIDAVWVLVSIQSITASPFFNEYQSLHEIVKIALKYFELANESVDTNIMSLTYFLFGRCLASFSLLDDQEIDLITGTGIIQGAYFFIEKKFIPDIGSVLNYIQNYIYNNENTIIFNSMGFVQLFYTIFTLCENKDQIQILDILNNAAVEPFESTLEILKSRIVNEYIPGILESARLSLKKAGVTLVLTLVVKVPLSSNYELKLFNPTTKEEESQYSGEVVFKLVQNTFQFIIDLLDCEDDEIIRYCLQVLHYITSEVSILQKSQGKRILDLFDLDAREALFDTLNCNNEVLRGLSANIIRSLENYQRSFEK